MAKLFDKDTPYIAVIWSIFILFIVVVVVAVFLGNLSLNTSVEGTIGIVLNEGDLVINYIDGNEVEINNKKEHTYGVTVSNFSDTKVFYSIYLNQDKRKNISIKINDSEGNIVNEINDDTSNKKLINLFSIDAYKTERYTIVIKNKSVGKLKAKLKVVNDSMTTETFSDLILVNNDLNVPSSRLGVDAATSNEGLISTIDNKGTSYYFRGDVSDNYVKLEDMYFRIVRINGDNTVRLVLDNVLEKQVPYNTNKLEGDADVSSLALLKDASIKSYLDEWVDTNLSSVKKYISNGDYCTDISFNNEVNNIKYSVSYERIYNDKAPDLYCSGSIYKGKVGLLSADEVVLAGGVVGTPNSKYYLYNNDIVGNYVTSSSYFINSSKVIAMINVMSNGALGEGTLITNATYIRPVINISESAKVKGMGTIDDPYIIVS